MTTCSTCGAGNAEEARYCGGCGRLLAVTCPRCQAPVDPRLRFCTSCGEALEGRDRRSEPEALQPAVAERRRVSVLFADLEGFTALAESLDPEEVRAVQSRYFDAARAVIARFGGTIEKFIGDAVVAVWGAPMAHEDDGDRAVRAAIALVDAVGRLGGAAARHRLTGRASVASGEAAVTVGAIGEGIVSGDLVNVASRLQGLAPSGGVLVDEATRTLAPDAAVYSPVGDLSLRGRQMPVHAHRAVARGPAAVSPRRGGHSGPFVGRDRELGELVDLFDAVVRDGRSRLVSITGIAGIGKSRLVWELASILEARPTLTHWHAGRAPAYGDQITFAAVAEMVRHRVGAPEGSSAELVERQLATMLAELVRDEEERRWIEPRIAALLRGESLDGFARDDLFGAWRRFFERVAATSPSVLVFEDLQWADPALVDFVEHLATWSRHVPMLIVTLARPELLERRAAWGAAAARFTAMHLERLPDAAMRTLLQLRAPGLDDALVARVLEHAGGVPLYAVEVARALADTPAGEVDGLRAGAARQRRGEAADAGPPDLRIEVPDSLHGLIAARIDALPAPERRLLLAAAVLGRRFRADGLVAIGAERPSLRDRVVALVRRELLALDEADGDPLRSELTFVQEVVREVAYRTLARQERRTLHLAAARWLESLSDDAATEGLAGHLVAAHDLAPDHADAHRIARRAVSALRRAAALDLGRHVPGRALGHLEHALRLTGGVEQRTVVLDEAAAAAMAAGRLDQAEEHLRELVRVHADAGRRREAARTRARLASVLLTAQRNETAARELEMALRAMRDVGRDAGGVELAAQLARARVLIGDGTGALSWAERALEAATRLGLEALAADVLVTRGSARVGLGDKGGLDDLRRAVDEAARIGAIGVELRARNNLAWLLAADDPRLTLETARQAVDLAARMGVGDLAAQLAEVACAAAVDTGDWEWALATIDELRHGGTPHANRVNLAATATMLRALRGEPDPAGPLTELEPLPADLDEQVRAGVDLAMGWVALMDERTEAARDLADAACVHLLGVERVNALALATRACLWSGDREAAAQRLAEVDAAPAEGSAIDALRLTLQAGLTALDGVGRAASGYRRARDAWQTLELQGDLALAIVDEARLTGRGPNSSDAALLDRLGAAGLRSRATPRVSAPRGPRPPGRSPRPSARTASRTDAGRRRPPASGHRRPRG